MLVSEKLTTSSTHTHRKARSRTRSSEPVVAERENETAWFRSYRSKLATRVYAGSGARVGAGGELPLHGMAQLSPRANGGTRRAPAGDRAAAAGGGAHATR